MENTYIFLHLIEICDYIKCDGGQEDVATHFELDD